MTSDAPIDKIRKAFALALHPETGQAERNAAWIGALRIFLAHGFRTLDAFIEAASEGQAEDDEVPYGWEMVMPFGKHKGHTLGQIATQWPDYLEWLAEQTFRSARLNEAARSVYEWQVNRG